VCVCVCVALCLLYLLYWRINVLIKHSAVDALDGTRRTVAYMAAHGVSTSLLVYLELVFQLTTLR